MGRYNQDEFTELTILNRYILSGLLGELQFLLARRNRKLWLRAAESMPRVLNFLKELLAFINGALTNGFYNPSILQKILAKRPHLENTAVLASEWALTLNAIYDQLANHLLLNSEGEAKQIELLVTFSPQHSKLLESLKLLLGNELAPQEKAFIQELITPLEQLINLQEISQNRTKVKEILARRWQNIKNTSSCYTQEVSVLNGLCVQLAEYLSESKDKSEVYSLLMPDVSQEFFHQSHRNHFNNFEFGEFIITDDGKTFISIDGIVERAKADIKAANALDLWCFVRNEKGVERRALSENEIKRLQRICPVFESVVKKAKAYASAMDIDILSEFRALQKALFAGSMSGNGSSYNASGKATAGIAKFIDSWEKVHPQKKKWILKLESNSDSFNEVIIRITTKLVNGRLECVYDTQRMIDRLITKHRETLEEFSAPTDDGVRTKAEYLSCLDDLPSTFTLKKAAPASRAQPSHDSFMLELYHFACNQVARLAKKTSPSENEKSKLAHFQWLSLQIWSEYEKMQQLEGENADSEKRQMVRDMLAQVQEAMFTRTSILPKQSVSGTQWLEFLDSKEVSLNGVLTFAEIATNKKNPKLLHITNINPKAPRLQLTAKEDASRDLRFDNPCRMFRSSDTSKLINAGDLTTQLFGSEAGQLARCFGTIAHFLLTQLDRVARRNDPKKGADLKYLALRALWMKYYPIAFHFQNNREESQQKDVREFLAELKVVCAAQINRGFTRPTSAKNWNKFLTNLQKDFPAELLNLDFGKLAIRFKDQEYINRSLTRAGGQSPLISQHFLKHRPKLVRFVDDLTPIAKNEHSVTLTKGNK